MSRELLFVFTFGDKVIVCSCAGSRSCGSESPSRKSSAESQYSNGSSDDSSHLDLPLIFAQSMTLNVRAKSGRSLRYKMISVVLEIEVRSSGLTNHDRSTASARGERAPKGDKSEKKERANANDLDEDKMSDERKDKWMEEAIRIDEKFLISDNEDSPKRIMLPPINGIKVEVIPKRARD